MFSAIEINKLPNRVTEDAIVSRRKSIMLLNLPISYSFWKFFLNPRNILEIIPTKIDLLFNIHANLANQHKEKHNQLQITTLNRHETLSTEKNISSIVAI